VTTALKAIPQQKLQKYFQQWQHCLAKCIAPKGEYFEGETSQQAVSILVCCNKMIPGISDPQHVYWNAI
jgi:hypothetical protein